MPDEAIRHAVQSTLRENSLIVERWLRGQPKTWGPLAGMAVAEYTKLTARSLSDSERRLVWQALWDELCRLQSSGENA